MWGRARVRTPSQHQAGVLCAQAGPGGCTESRETQLQHKTEGAPPSRRMNPAFPAPWARQAARLSLCQLRRHSRPGIMAVSHCRLHRALLCSLSSFQKQLGPEKRRAGSQAPRPLLMRAG